MTSTGLREVGRRPGRQSLVWTRLLLLMRRVGHRPGLAIAAAAALGFLGSAGLGVARGLPLPAIHDEFSYLLAAETFASGRLSNPTHPLWQHFETFHVIHEPTYQSKYPPGPGALLAIGQALAGHPAWGLWIGAGVLAGTLTWALLLWLPASWAMLAAIGATAQITWFSYWSQSYWGGAVAAIGGALCFGCYRALSRRPQMRHGVLFGLGLGILALSRPFEGALAGGLVGLALTLRGFAKRPAAVPWEWARAGGLAFLVLSGMLGALGVYNHAVTGSWSTMPYQVYEEQYAAAPTFLFMSPGPAPEYRHAEIEQYWMEWGRERHELERSPRRLPGNVSAKILRALLFFLGPGAVALFGLRYHAGSLDLRFAMGSLVLVFAATLLTKGSYPHYSAPVTLLFFVLVGAGLNGLHRRSRTNGSLNIAPWILVAWMLATAAGIVGLLRSSSSEFAAARNDLSLQLRETPGDHVVLVRYGEGHDVHEEWVYNRADIDNARIVWARSMGTSADAELRSYFSDRTHWVLTVGQEVRLDRLP